MKRAIALTKNRTVATIVNGHCHAKQAEATASPSAKKPPRAYCGEGVNRATVNITPLDYTS